MGDEPEHLHRGLVVQEEDRELTFREHASGKGSVGDRFARARGNVGHVRQRDRGPVVVEGQRDRTVPGVGDERGEAGTVGEGDAARGDDAVVVAPDRALIGRGALARGDARAAGAAALGRGTRHEDLARAVDDGVQVGRAAREATDDRVLAAVGLEVDGVAVRRGRVQTAPVPAVTAAVPATVRSKARGRRAAARREGRDPREHEDRRRNPHSKAPQAHCSHRAPRWLLGLFSGELSTYWPSPPATRAGERPCSHYASSRRNDTTTSPRRSGCSNGRP
jgi:hypothetical protein